eukprot:CAMPEP_0171888900 /NCGR_PEP_ID=MMETSP0992-20121227/43279_2 /TAXON_ID=483369 /ORGANISM="non described non described, Strain CCMP2098" /LENGTH=80 /DNA_ID=CAMNT_0012515853 /DNA_START=757 /DNA_END=1000 /DNA_ORIENTATION=-
MAVEFLLVARSPCRGTTNFAPRDWLAKVGDREHARVQVRGAATWAVSGAIIQETTRVEGRHGPSVNERDLTRLQIVFGAE